MALWLANYSSENISAFRSCTEFGKFKCKAIIKVKRSFDCREWSEWITFVMGFPFIALTMHYWYLPKNSPYGVCSFGVELNVCSCVACMMNYISVSWRKRSFMSSNCSPRKGKRFIFFNFNIAFFSPKISISFFLYSISLLRLSVFPFVVRLILFLGYVAALISLIIPTSLSYQGWHILTIFSLMSWDFPHSFYAK